MSTCLYAFELISLDSLMITYPYLEMLCTFTSLIDHVLTYVPALTIIFSHVYLLSESYVSRFTYFDVHILLYSHALIITHTSMFTCFVDHMLLCSHASMIVCSNVYVLWWSHVHLPVCLQAHMLGLIDDYLPLCWIALYVHMTYWSCAHRYTCFDDNILTCLPAFRIICF